jgi:hypothetical protein
VRALAFKRTRSIQQVSYNRCGLVGHLGGKNRQPDIPLVELRAEWWDVPGTCPFSHEAAEVFLYEVLPQLQDAQLFDAATPRDPGGAAVGPRGPNENSGRHPPSRHAPTLERVSPGP